MKLGRTKNRRKSSRVRFFVESKTTRNINAIYKHGNRLRGIGKLHFSIEKRQGVVRAKRSDFSEFFCRYRIDYGVVAHATETKRRGGGWRGEKKAKG